MPSEKATLKAIREGYIKNVLTPTIHCDTEHWPIFDTNLQIIGYFNIRCADELRKTLAKSHPANATPFGLS